MKRGICPIAAQAVTLRLPGTSVSGHLGVYYAAKVAQYAQNLEVKGLTYVQPVGSIKYVSLYESRAREASVTSNTDERFICWRLILARHSRHNIEEAVNPCVRLLP